MADVTQRSVTKARGSDKRELQRAVFDVVDKYLRDAGPAEDDDAENAEHDDEDGETGSASDLDNGQSRSHHDFQRHASSSSSSEDRAHVRAHSRKRPRTRDSYVHGHSHGRRSKHRRVERAEARDPASPPPIDARAMADLGQDLASVIADAAPAWLDPDSSTMRKLQKGLVRVIVDFVVNTGAGGGRKARETPASAPPLSRRPARNAMWDAPPLPSRTTTPQEYRTPARHVHQSPMRIYTSSRSTQARSTHPYPALRDDDAVPVDHGLESDGDGSDGHQEYEGLWEKGDEYRKSVWDPKSTPPGAGAHRQSSEGDDPTWTAAEDERLRRLRSENYDWREIANRIGKTYNSVKRRYSKLPLFGGPRPLTRRKHDKITWTREDEERLIGLMGQGLSSGAMRSHFPNRTLASIKAKGRLIRMRDLDSPPEDDEADEADAAAVAAAAAAAQGPTEPERPTSAAQPSEPLPLE